MAFTQFKLPCEEIKPVQIMEYTAVKTEEDEKLSLIHIQMCIRDSFQREVKIAGEKWKDELEKGDPFYNPNLSLYSGVFEIDK